MGDARPPAVPTSPIEGDAFEEIMDRLVGDTLFTRARNLERILGFGQIWLKFEGDNPTGTQKDRIAFAHALDALRRGYDIITVATCGNFGVALAMASKLAGIRCEIVIPEGYHTKRTKEMEAQGANVRRHPGTYEDAVEHSQQLALAHEWYDANPGGVNVHVQLTAYGEIANEIYEQLRDAPAAVAVSMSNGTTLAGIHRGFVRLDRRGKVSRIPKIVGGTSWRKNPIAHAFRNGLERCVDLSPTLMKETVTNEPLINWRSLDGDEALHAMRSSGGHAADISDKRMIQMARTLKDEQGLHVLPASTAGLLALVQLHDAQPLPPDRYVAVLTGRDQ
jgi:threonine synthase